MASKSRHIVPTGDGWAVRKAGSERASKVTTTQQAAEMAAKKAVARDGGGKVYVHGKDGRIKGKFTVEGGGEVRVHGRDGRIRGSDTVKPGRDPNPPKDKKH
jgi:hypothetical protein